MRSNLQTDASNKATAESGAGLCQADIRRYAGLAAAAVLLTVVAWMLSARQNTQFLKTHAYYGDTATFTAANFQAGFTARREGRWAAVAEQLATNGTDPLRIIPVLAVSPSLMLHPNGHLPTAAFMLFLFLLLLSITIYQRTGSWVYAISGMLVVLSAQRFYDPVSGMAAGYLDLHSSYLMGAALCALLNSDEARSLRWLALFGAFAAMVALSRWVAAGYCLVVCGPVLAFYLVKRWMADEAKWRCLNRRLLAVSLPILLLAGYYLAAFSPENFVHYHAVGYGLGLPLKDSLQNVQGVISRYFGVSGMWLLGLLLISYFALNWSRCFRISEVLVSLWLGFVFFLFYVFVMRVAGDPTTPYYMLPGIYILSLAPFSIDRKRPGTQEKSASYRAAQWVAAASGMAAIFLSASGCRESFTRHASPTDYQRREYTFMRELSGQLADAARTHVEPVRLPTFDTFFFPYGRSLLVEAAILSGTELRWQQIFNKHDVVWLNAYAGKDRSDIPRLAYDALQSTCDFAAILQEPESPAAAPLFMNDLGGMNTIAVQVVKYANDSLAGDSAKWKKLQETDSPWGKVDLYMNLGRSGLIPSVK